MSERSLAFVFGAIFATYFIIYPTIYFGWNFLVVSVGMGQYAIPGFWIGMLSFLLLILFRNFLKGFFR